MQSEAVHQAIELSPADQAAAPVGHYRLRGALLLAPCLVLVWLSFLLAPRDAAYGTHEQLGLPACSFLSRTGYPCPSCGMTTAFAAMAHGRVALAFEAQPFGMVLFVAVCVVGAAALAELITGRDVLRHLRPGAWWAASVAVGLAAGWGLKVLCGLAGGTLPIR